MRESLISNCYKVNGLTNSPLADNQKRVTNGYLLTIIVFILNLSSTNHQVSCRGGAITRGSGGAKGPHRRYNENEETDTLGVVLVVILPVAQMIAVLTIIVLLRICYRRYCLPNGLNNTNYKIPTSGPTTSSLLPSIKSPLQRTASITNTTTKQKPSQY
ncbi:uncharacterized protein LOC128389534 [Panonychus citri]|uniref:uncharacterized protein LOC128389534 n=1 Tax=Panonychus citri TaxID=50023 RepID=UPI0023080515|nr:uncharacterized protein LOC128389534 [Panonychus citri]